MKRFIVGMISIFLSVSYSVANENSIYVYSGLDRYSESNKTGKLISTIDDVKKEVIEHFGLALTINNDWETSGEVDKFKSNQFGGATYSGYFQGSKKKVFLHIGMSPKNPEETFKDMTMPNKYSKIKLGSSIVNGHSVDVYYYETYNNKKTNGSIYLFFKDKMYFTDEADSNADFFPMLTFISLSGELFDNLNSKDIQKILDRHIVPLFNTIKVTDLNTFATDTSKINIPFQLLYYTKINEKVKKVSNKSLQKSIDPFSKFKLLPIKGKTLEWKNFVVFASDEWYKNSVKSNETTLTLQTNDILDLEIVVLNTKVFKFEKKYKNIILEGVYKSMKDDSDYSQVVLHMQSKYMVLGNKECPMVTALGDNNMKIYTFIPYHKGKLYTIVVISSDVKEKNISPRVERLLKTLTFKSVENHKKRTKKPLRDLNFEVSIHYTSPALRKLQENGEEVSVNVMIDQYGKQYMEEEAIAYKEVTILPKQKAVFHGMPPTNNAYRYKKNKKYIATINIYSARKVFVNNLLNCSGEMEFNIKDIDGKVIEFECKLIR